MSSLSVKWRNFMMTCLGLSFKLEGWVCYLCGGRPMQCTLSTFLGANRDRVCGNFLLQIDFKSQVGIDFERLIIRRLFLQELFSKSSTISHNPCCFFQHWLQGSIGVCWLLFQWGNTFLCLVKASAMCCDFRVHFLKSWRYCRGKSCHYRWRKYFCNFYCQ